MAMETTAHVNTYTPLNRACANCARAKAKCLPDSEPGGKCARCQRLQKPCEPIPARSRALPRKRRVMEPSRVTKNHVEKLEEKLDGLVNLLKSTREVEAVGNTPPSVSHVTFETRAPETQPLPTQNTSPSSSEATVRESGSGSTSHLDARRHNCQAHHFISESAAETEHRVNHPVISICSELGIDDQEANLLLTMFRDEMCPYFPFIVIPDSVSAQDLRRDKPFLYLAVLAISTRKSLHQQELGKVIIRQLAERMLINGERSMDLLLGILTYAAWCYYHFFNVPQLTSLMSTAHTLIYDLGLNKSTFREPLTVYQSALRSTCGIKQHAIPTRTIEEQRTLLGCFYLSAAVSFAFQRSDPLPHTSYIDQCCDDLADVDVHKNDRFAVAFIRLQTVSDRINQAPWNVPRNSLGLSCPPVLFVKALQEQLQTFERAFSTEMSQNVCLLLIFRLAEVSLFKAGLSKSPKLALSSERDFDRLELLHACLRSLKTFFGIVHALPVSSYHCNTVPLLQGIGRAHVVLHLLCSFEHPDWDLDYCDHILRFSDVLLTLAERMERASSALGFQPPGSDIFLACAKTLRRAEECCRVGSAGQVPDLPPKSEAELPDFTSSALDDWTMYLDEAMLRDVIGPFGTHGFP